MVIELTDTELDQRILRVVEKRLRAHRDDSWLNATNAALHLKMSKSHFLRLCRKGAGPQGHGESKRLTRWRRSTLDEWLERGCPA
jgi:predicted DNA-binding transcriptional regulator AlpA